jgi:hypothetical protein
MQDAIYHIHQPCQAAFLRKSDLKCTGYITITVSYDHLKKLYPLITFDAYDLYITLLSIYFQNSNEKFKISAKELMYRAAFTRPATYNNARNKLLTYDLIKIFTGKVHNSINTFKPRTLSPSCFFIPHSIYFWLNDSVRKKEIPRAGKLAYIYLYQQFVINNYCEFFEVKNTDVADYLYQPRKTYFCMINKLKKIGFVEFSELKNQRALRKFKLLIPHKISLPVRKNAPRPVLSIVESQGRLAQIISKISS